MDLIGLSWGKNVSKGQLAPKVSSLCQNKKQNFETKIFKKKEQSVWQFVCFKSLHDLIRKNQLEISRKTKLFRNKVLPI